MTRRAVLITGGARRVGAALCLHFAKAGYDIALHYNHSQTEAEQVQQQVRALGVACEIFAQDLAEISALPALINKVQKAFPCCDMLINNASVFERAEFLETDEALFDRQFYANFKAPFFLTQAFAKAFGRGSVVNIVDTDVVQTQGSHFAYLMSKKALADFTPMAARALGPNVRVNAVAPGIMLPSSELDEDYMGRLAEVLPLRNTASIVDMISTVFWLSQNTGLTGQCIFVDGGQHAL